MNVVTPLEAESKVLEVKEELEEEEGPCHAWEQWRLQEDFKESTK